MGGTSTLAAPEAEVAVATVGLLALRSSARGTEDKAGDEEVDDGEEGEGEAVKLKEEDEEDEEDDCID